MMTLIDLFSGIGGWLLGALWAGDIEIIGYSENDKNKINTHELRFPGITNYGDIRNTDCEYSDIYTVSFPCTGISVMGLGKGLEDSKSKLWFDAERIIRHNRPKYVAIENGPALNIRGLRRILEFFAEIGYHAEWTHLQGYQFGVQQRRKRLFLIAYSSEGRLSGTSRIPIFRKLEEGKREHPKFVYPGFAGRWEIPQPRAYRTTNDLPGIVHRLEGTGDAVMPIIACYIFKCIKLHYHATNER